MSSEASVSQSANMFDTSGEYAPVKFIGFQSHQGENVWFRSSVLILHYVLGVVRQKGNNNCRYML